jgi:chorismate mutase
MKNKKLDIIRVKIDKLDYKLLNLIKKRTNLVNKVIKVKKLKKHIVDNSRIKTVLKNVKKNSIKKKIDPKITQRIWSTMIKSYIEYEKRNFNKK